MVKNFHSTFIMAEKIKEKKDKSGRLLYEFYAVPLLHYWEKKKRKRITLNRMLACLESKDRELVNDNLKGCSVPLTLLKGILFLLIETDFHQQFFDIGLTPRIDHFNSEKKAMEHYRYLSLLVSENDPIWGRWLNLFELRYDFNENERRLGKDPNNQEELFKEIENHLSLWPGFRDYLQKLETCEADLTRDKEKKEFNALKKEICSHISSKFKIINLFFQLSFYETWRGWLRNQYLYKRKDEAGRKAAEEKIASLKAEADNVLKQMEDMNFRDKHPAFYEDYRMMRLYHLGTNLIGTPTVHFKKFDHKERLNYLEEGEKLLEQMAPEIGDTFQYRIWFEYYRYLHLQREMEHCLAKNRIREGLIKAETALNALKDLEDKIQGGFSKILLKAKYQKRGLEYIISTLEAMLLEKELEQPYGLEYRINERQQANKDTSFERIQAWMKTIRKNVLGSDDANGTD
jgi:hypothetical protein